jgi:hypothetical protein
MHMMLYSVFINLECFMPGQELSENSAQSVDQLQQVAGFMQEHDITATLLSGRLEDGKLYEGITFECPPGNEIGRVLFTDGHLVSPPIDELERRLGTPGFVNHVVRPVQRAAAIVYKEGADLLDERFDVLPGFME